jgi:hypothetical protein
MQAVHLPCPAVKVGQQWLTSGKMPCRAHAKLTDSRHKSGAARDAEKVRSMSIGSISFYQQDQSYWNTLQNQNQASSAESALISVMSSAQTSKESGLSSIANQEALTRVNKQIAADEQALTNSSSSSSTSSSSSSAAASSTPNATGTGTVPLTWNTSLLTLGIPQNGAVTVSDGTNTTAYASNGSDTVGDLISAINANVAGNAYVSASLNSTGKLVITAKNTTDTVTVGGTFASDVGFGPSNTTFQPNSAATPVTPQYSSGTATGSGTAASTTKSSAIVPAASISASAAESVLTASGETGTLVNMLA